MDSKRPDVRVDDRPDEEGRVSTLPGGGGDDRSDRSLLRRIARYLKR